MRYMVIERFKDNRLADVYLRFEKRGRMMPNGLEYLDSWVSADLRVCYQLMQTEDAGLFERWTSEWDDLVDFEIVPVRSSGEARSRATQAT